MVHISLTQSSPIWFNDPDGYMQFFWSCSSTDGTWDYYVESTCHLELKSTTWDRRIYCQIMLDRNANSSITGKRITMKNDNNNTNTTKTLWKGSNGSLEKYCWGKKGGDIVYIPCKVEYECQVQLVWAGPHKTTLHSWHTMQPGISVIVPYMPPTGGSAWGESNGTVRKPHTFTYTAYWGGINFNTQRNMTFALQVNKGGSWQEVASTVSSSSSGSVSARLSIGASVGTTRWNFRLVVRYAGGEKVFSLGSKDFLEPLPSPPTMGNVNNTTWSSINTNRNKVISANWGVSYSGWRITPITYEWECYSDHYGRIGSGTGGTSASFSWNMPAKDVRDWVHFRVRAHNNTGWSSWKDSGKVELYWAYIETDKISNISVNPNRYQLFYGGTLIKPTATSRINGWGDRPGNRNVEYEIRTDTGTLKWYGRSTTSSTGNFNQTLPITVSDNHLHKTYYVTAHKRLDNTEYLTSNDARYPTLGQNNISAPITFYEVQGRISGHFNLNPSIIVSGIPSEIEYTFNYDRQSSQKVDVFLEVYRITTGKVTHITHLESGKTETKTHTGMKKDILVVKYQADRYELRLKATVTELLGNKNTYTLATLTPEVYNPPVGHISLNHVSLPLPTDNANAILAKQATDITWNYDYSFQGVNITKVLLTIESKPYGKELIELPFNASSSPYYNNYIRRSIGDFELGSTVKASIMIYYQVIGYPIVYTEPTNSFTINITPTRYLYYLTQTSTGERQLVKIHPLVNKKDETSKKLHID